MQQAETNEPNKQIIAFLRTKKKGMFLRNTYFPTSNMESDESLTKIKNLFTRAMLVLVSSGFMKEYNCHTFQCLVDLDGVDLNKLIGNLKLGANHAKH